MAEEREERRERERIILYRSLKHRLDVDELNSELFVTAYETVIVKTSVTTIRLACEKLYSLSGKE